MNPDPVYERLRETGWRRPLTEAEQAELRAWLVAHPEQHADIDVEAALSQALAKLADAPMPTNFTTRVLQVIEREEQRAGRAKHQSRAPWWRVLMPRIAAVTVLVAVSSVTYWRYQAVKQEELVSAARNLVTLSDPTVLEDFEVIRRMSQADEGLLALSDDLLSLKQ